MKRESTEVHNLKKIIYEGNKQANEMMRGLLLC